MPSRKSPKNNRKAKPTKQTKRAAWQERNRLDKLNRRLSAADPDKHFHIPYGVSEISLPVKLGKAQFYAEDTFPNGNTGEVLAPHEVVEIMGASSSASGFTYPARKDEDGNTTAFKLEEGYAAAIQGTKLAISAQDLVGSDGKMDFRGAGMVRVRAWMVKHAELLAEPNAFLGGWRDGVSVWHGEVRGTYEINVSLVFYDLTLAEQFGARNDQVSVWGFKEQDEFETGGRNESVI